MNCHNNNGNRQPSNHKKHMWLMVLCCTLPIVFIAIFTIFKISTPTTKGLLAGSVFLLCPLMHLLMLPMMFGWGKKNKVTHQVQSQPVSIDVKKIEN